MSSTAQRRYKRQQGFWSTHFSWLPRNCRVAILYFLAEEPIQNREQQDCCLIVEVHVPDRVDDQWVQQAVENGGRLATRGALARGHRGAGDAPRSRGAGWLAAARLDPIFLQLVQ